MLKIDWTMLLQVGNFFLLFWVLNKFLYLPLLSVMAKRKQELENSTQCVSALKADCIKNEEEYQAQLAIVQQEAAQERSALNKALATEEESVLEAARTQAADQLQEVREESAKHRQQAIEEIAQEAPLLAKEIASKILGRTV